MGKGHLLGRLVLLDLERSARAELKLRHKAIGYYLSQQDRTS
jgi:hypothetical protein